jgi:ribosomal protein S27AE
MTGKVFARRERVLWSDYIVRGSKMEFDNCFIRCPRCGAPNTSLNHGESTVCPGCGLKMELWGNALYIGDRI